MMGFDCLSFDRILDKFGPMFSRHTPFDESRMIVELEYTHGQKRVVQPANCLGLVLVWTPTRGSLNVLQLVFGLTLPNLSVYLRFGIRLMVETFKNDPLARVAIPCNEDIESFKVAFAERHPLLNDCWVTMDGLKLYLQSAGNSEIQERFYNGWTHDHYVTSVFFFCPDGTILIAFFNVLGCVHDSQVAEFSQIYEKLENVYQRTGGMCCIDSAFGSISRNFYINRARISWVPTHLHVGRGSLRFRKKGRQHQHSRRLSGECSQCRLLSQGRRIDLCMKREESGGLS